MEGPLLGEGRRQKAEGKRQKGEGEEAPGSLLAVSRTVLRPDFPTLPSLTPAPLPSGEGRFEIPLLHSGEGEGMREGRREKIPSLLGRGIG
jgi:hypothetical protein